MSTNLSDTHTALSAIHTTNDQHKKDVGVINAMRFTTTDLANYASGATVPQVQCFLTAVSARNIATDIISKAMQTHEFSDQDRQDLTAVLAKFEITTATAYLAIGNDTSCVGTFTLANP